jgi:Co/Zn/Cd efflux system component
MNLRIVAIVGLVMLVGATLLMPEEGTMRVLAFVVATAGLVVAVVSFMLLRKQRAAGQGSGSTGSPATP